MTPLAEVLLWLFVMNLGIAYGARLYEKRIVLPMCFSKSSGMGSPAATRSRGARTRSTPCGCVAHSSVPSRRSSMNVIGHQVPFFDPAFPLRRKLAEHFAQVLPELRVRRRHLGMKMM